ncbi:glutamine-hydrolyzing carbamoyl-phosphate synthase small subunit [Moorella sulfitireducens (nom. illeg.)]|uniref:glutamine-hydrolyzing carbamoyl-phosphate synthase small subunit n=1 Tax=Neomoorella sulfitireducens TaxID=2972948 RepID=UPI0021AC36C4|nr:glutamine-hydrolyzing carbamoyl-phosphate synthase small subunit [Moorella sulfitireducens]
MQGFLVLADGTVFTGEAFGHPGSCHGEVVFNTSMTGYQEILTDPSYCGQIVVLTYPLIGNYGINAEDLESERPQVAGFIVHEACSRPSNWRATGDIDRYLKENRIPALQGVDTRALTRHLRRHGTMRGILAAGDVNLDELKDRAVMEPPLSGPRLVPAVTNKEPFTVAGGERRIVLYNFGVKENIIRWLRRLDCTVTVMPAGSRAADILAARPHGVVVSNGPGDPKDVPYGVATIRELLGKVPVMGICLGHQLLALALGADTYKLPFGHRGGNHPVKDLSTGRVYITSQNHGYAVRAETLPDEATVTHINLNDGTVEGLRHRQLPVFSVQYHPESSPGPTDSEYLFHEFIRMVDANRGKEGH